MLHTHVYTAQPHTHTTHIEGHDGAFIVAGCSWRGACRQPKRDTELSVVVLTSGFWPATTAEPAQLPADVQKVARPAAAPWPAGSHPLCGRR